MSQSNALRQSALELPADHRDLSKFDYAELLRVLDLLYVELLGTRHVLDRFHKRFRQKEPIGAILAQIALADFALANAAPLMGGRAVASGVVATAAGKGVSDVAK